MKLLIIGHSVEDHILINGNEIVKPGGIYYTAAALQSFKEASDEIFLLTAVEKNNYKLFSKIYDKFDHSFFQTPESIPKVFLKVHENDERDECYNHVTENLKINIHDVAIFDGILINMITGFDIDLQQLMEIRKSFKGLIYFDVHTLSRGLEEDGMRKFRTIPEFRKWGAMLDIIQVNEHELLTLSRSTEKPEIVREILEAGPQYLILTMESLGARIYFLKDGELNSIFKPALRIDAKNKIGCGDIFGAVFFYGYLTNRNIVKSLELANTAAGLTAQYADINEIEKLKEDVLSRYN